MDIKTDKNVNTEILSEVLNGLNQNPKMLPSKYLYDERGSQLFDEICELEEYYPTRTEMQIMQDNIIEIGELLGEGTLLIELGSGSSQKIKLLLDHIPGLAGYIPIDISSEHLLNSCKVLQEEYPDLNIFPLAADYTNSFSLPKLEIKYDHKAIYFPGSTIGNFTKKKAKEFINRIANIAGENGGLIIGVDLKKDKKILEDAYNDRKGITAEFNLNILNHLNDEINSDFDLVNFKHYAFFNEVEDRIEMHLISKKDQTVKIGDSSVEINNGEHIITEYSYKYTLEEFKELVSVHFELKKYWTDANNLFSIQYFKVKI
ncbi:MAG: L-histidine N(alpha)-methyltransferase [Ignavibacteriales bacterium CG12_big_fil_rev_8_21_14_0_65_30_8]|nr:MAG: L-histidine N(alpha)-methyltransferase [Ignavibacteriales bacterium CG12_big_fil_rev_8_21_14_0_65_30_8]